MQEQAPDKRSEYQKLIDDNNERQAERIRQLDKQIKSLDFHIGIADGFVYGSVGILAIFGLFMLYLVVTKA